MGRLAIAITNALGSSLDPLTAFMNGSTFYAPLRSSLVLTRGTGSPTFTRATVATVVDFEGLVKNCISGEARFTGARRVQNLFAGNTETLAPFQAPAAAAGAEQWTAYSNGNTITIGQSDPNGGTGAIKMTLAASTNNIGYRSSKTRNRQYRFSVWARVASGTLTFRLSATDTLAWVTASVSGTLTATTTWQRFSLLIDGIANGWAAAANIDVNIGGESKTPFSTSGGDLIVAFPILEEITGQTNQNPSEYVSVGVLSAPYHGANVDGVKYFETANGNTVASNVVTEATGAAIADATLKGYLAEVARENVCLQSADMATTWVNVRSTETVNATTAPDGTATADKLVEDATAASDHNIYQGITATAVAWTLSAYVKAGERTWCFVAFNNAGDHGVMVNLSTGAIGTTVGTITSSSIESVGNGWYRVQITKTLTAATWYLIVCTADADAASRPSTDGDITKGIYVWGFQAEIGAFASSYIPTTTGAVTRNADVLTYPASGNILGTTGTAYCEVTTLAGTGTAQHIVGRSTGGAVGVPLFFETTDTLNIYDGFSVRSTVAVTRPIAISKKIASSWGGSATMTCQAGTLGSAGAFDGDMSLAANIAIGHDAGANRWMNGTVRGVRIELRDFPNDILQAATR